MAISSTEVLKINLVLVGVGLINTKEEFDNFRQEVSTDVVVAGTGLTIGLPITTPELGRTLTLNRDRISLELSGARSAINRDYPSLQDLDRLAEVAGFAIEKTNLEDQDLRAFGYNIELVYQPDTDTRSSASRYISEKIFVAGIPGIEEWNLVGGGGRLLYKGDDKVWQVGIESRFNDDTDSRVFMTLNMHLDATDIPNQKEIRESLNDIWTQAHKFITRLDKFRT